MKVLSWLPRKINQMESSVINFVEKIHVFQNWLHDLDEYSVFTFTAYNVGQTWLASLIEMFLTAGCLYLYAVHWLRRTRKHALYKRTVTDIFQRGSVLVHKYGTHDTLTDQLLRDVTYLQRVNHISDVSTILSEIIPKVYIYMYERYFMAC